MSTEDFNLYTKQRLGLLDPINANQIQYLDMMGNLYTFFKSFSCYHIQNHTGR